jgi:pimeloyl-ACP methyl ester carboxylesterase
VNGLTETNECHVFTFAGFGDVAPIEKPWLPKIKKSIEDYISEKNLKKATIIGHSLGGSLALWLASDEKSDFRKIIVIDALPSVGALMMPNFNSDNIVYENPYNKQLLEMDAENFKKMAIQFSVGMTLNKEKQPQIKDWILQADRETYVYGYTDLLKLDLREEVSKIKVPVLILAATEPYGEENVKKTYDEQYKNLANYSIKYAKNSAHFIMYDQPEWFLNAIKTELK